jgi:hypothetical protein
LASRPTKDQAEAKAEAKAEANPEVYQASWAEDHMKPQKAVMVIGGFALLGIIVYAGTQVLNRLQGEIGRKL